MKNEREYIIFEWVISFEWEKINEVCFHSLISEMALARDHHFLFPRLPEKKQKKKCNIPNIFMFHGESLRSRGTAMFRVRESA